jgi:N-acetylglucosamine-6-sulfatase
MIRRRRILTSALLLSIVGASCLGGEDDTPEITRAKPKADAPNFLLIISDDQSTRLFNRTLMPRVFAEIVDQGVNFTRAYVNVPLCCPSRATILTGLAAHHTGVDTNASRLEGRPRVRPMFVRPLYEAGYRTMLAGKYVNSETCDPRPEWDRWACIQGGSQVDPQINVDGKTIFERGFSTDLLADRVIDFIKDSRAEGRPFFAYYAPKSPHEPANDPRAKSMPIEFYDPPSYDAQPDPGSLPAWARRQPIPSALATAHIAVFTRMAQQMPPMDAAIGRMLDSLGPEAADTFVLFMSDNGYLYGEHRLASKGLPYEESIRVPFAIRYPRALPRERHFASDALVGNVDIAATVMDLAGTSWGSDGISLAPLLTGQERSVREELLFEWCTATTGAACEEPGVMHRPTEHVGIETDRYVYIEYETGEAELYDLESDPFQLRNLAELESFSAVRRDLSRRLAALVAEPSPPETTIASGAAGEQVRDIVTFQFFSPALSTGFRCVLEGPGREGTMERCDSGSVVYRSLEPGSHRFVVQAIDAGGAVDPSPAERRFVVAG